MARMPTGICEADGEEGEVGLPEAAPVPDDRLDGAKLPIVQGLQGHIHQKRAQAHG